MNTRVFTWFSLDQRSKPTSKTKYPIDIWYVLLNRYAISQYNNTLSLNQPTPLESNPLPFGTESVSLVDSYPWCTVISVKTQFKTYQHPWKVTPFPLEQIVFPWQNPCPWCMVRLNKNNTQYECNNSFLDR